MPVLSVFKMPSVVKAGDKFDIRADAVSIAATNPPADLEITSAYGFAPVSSAVLGSLGTPLPPMMFDNGTYI